MFGNRDPSAITNFKAFSLSFLKPQVFFSSIPGRICTSRLPRGHERGRSSNRSPQHPPKIRRPDSERNERTRQRT